MSEDRPLSFWERARRDPDRPAIVDASDRYWSAGSVLDRCDAIASRLCELEIGVGSSVAVAAGNDIDALCVALAATQIGAYYVPISNRATEPEIAYIVDNSGAQVVFVEASVAGAALDAASAVDLADGRVVCFGEPPAPAGTVAVDHFVAAASGGIDVRRCGQVMPYTSGTTGRPKGVRRPLPDEDPDVYWGAASRSTLGVLDLDRGPDDVHLVVSPLYHTAIITLATAALHVGQFVVIRERFDPVDTLRAIERHRVTNAHLVPTQFHRLLALDESVRNEFDLASVRTLIHGAAPCPLGVKQRMIEWLGPVISEYYGASEGGGTFVTSEEWLDHPGTVGRPYPGAEIHILDDVGTPVPSGASGRVFIRPNGALFEYHGDPDKTDASRVGGLITAGDIGHLDEHGYLYLSGRAGDLIITGGVNVYPAEVEDALFGHPAVADAIVIGLPDDEWGESVTAIIELAAGWAPDESSQSSIVEHCAARLARYKLPKRIEFVTDLPREPNGKIRRPQLIAQFSPVT